MRNMPQETKHLSLKGIKIYKINDSNATSMCSSEKLYVLKNPENKARREGQTAAFCCKVDGTPEPNQYEW